MESVWQNGHEGDVAPVIDKEKVFSRILNQLAPAEESKSKRLMWWGKMAAAVIFILATAGTVYLITNKKNERPPIATTPTKNDVPPGHSGAVLTLSTGRKIVPDSAGNGQLVNDANVNIIKKDNGITYQGKTNEVVYNTISTPKGRQWQLQLIDGTKVWLNAASSIRYPLNFTGKERMVEITGEAYFEVVHNAKKPFRVQVNTALGNGGVIEDIGTTFNVNAYNDEPVVKTTLIEGEVKISTAQQKNLILEPGQQAVISDNSTNTQIRKNIDVEAVTAWKDGLFIFSEDGVEAIMRQISRWYNVDVFYQGGVPQKQIHGNAPRNTNLSSIIKVLSLCGVHTSVEEKNIIVKP